MSVVPVNPDEATMRQYYPALLERLRMLPGVEAAGAVDHHPFGGRAVVTFARADGPVHLVNTLQVLPGYFEALGIPLKAGRFLTDADAGAAVPGVVVDEEAARVMSLSESALGRLVEIAKKPYEVVGVVRDIHYRSLLQRDRPLVHLPYGGLKVWPLTVVVKHRGSVAMLKDQMRQVAHSLGTRVLVARVGSGADRVGTFTVTPRRRTALLGLLAGVGVALALVGVFGTTAFAVARRTREIGVRMVCGASPSAVVRSVVRDAVWPIGGGIVLGLGAAALATRTMSRLLFSTFLEKINPGDPLTLAAVSVVLAACGCAAAWLPARRAAQIDPAAVLRAE